VVQRRTGTVLGFSPAVGTQAPSARSRANQLYTKMTVAAVVFALVFEAGYFLSVKPPFDMLGSLIGRDFVNTWMGARAALDGQAAAWFDFDTYNRALQQMFGTNFPQHHMSYPPHLLLFTWPFGFLPYLPAYAIWCVAGFVLYMIAAAGGERRSDRLLMLAVSPAAILNIFGGQNGFFTAALLIGGLSLLDRRPVVSGVLFGLLTIKPQLGLLLPLMLMLTGRWTSIASAAATTLFLIAATAAAFGTDIWTAFVELSVPKQQDVLSYGSGIFPSMMPTAFMNARIAGLPLDWAWGIQTVMSAAALAAVVWTFWRRRDPVLSRALFLTASFLFTPYAFNYDMVVFGWMLMQLRDHESSQPIDDRLAMVVWMLPITTMILGLAYVPVSCLALAAFAARLIWRLRAEPEAIRRSNSAHSPA
jgi:hypothetical protein